MAILNYLFLGYCFLLVSCETTPHFNKHENKESYKKVAVIAHRAGRGHWPESSLEAIKQSLHHRIDVIEFDLVFSKQLTAFVNHDLIVDSKAAQAPCISHQRYILRQLTDEEIRKKIVCHSHTYEFKGAVSQSKKNYIAPKSQQKIFSFEETLEFISKELNKMNETQYKNQVQFSIELKQNNADDLQAVGLSFFDDSQRQTIIKKILEQLKKYKLREHIIFQSFHPDWLETLNKLAPDIPRSLLVAGKWYRRTPEDLMIYVNDHQAKTNPRFISPYGIEKLFVNLLDEPLTRHLQNHGYKLVPWTINSAADWQRLVSMGVDGIITDYPVSLKKWLKARIPLIYQ